MAVFIKKVTQNFSYLFTRRCLILSSNHKVLRKYSEFQAKNDADENHSSSSNSNSENDHDKSNLKLKISEEAMKYVLEYGWSKEAIIAGVKSLGLPNVSHGILSKGGVDLVFYFNSLCNVNLENILKEKPPLDLSQPNEISSVFLFEALKTRLEMIVPYVERWPEAIALLTLPQHIPQDLQHMRDLVDIVWHYAGDKNVYTKWYTRRLALGSIYKLSELYLSKDTSEGFANTWLFLDQQIEQLIENDSSFSELQSDLSACKDVGEGAFITLKNMLGLNRRFS